MQRKAALEKIGHIPALPTSPSSWGGFSVSPRCRGLMRTSIWLVRHGQTELNKARRYQGAGDSPLTPFGIRQAAALAQRLRRTPFGLAITSPAARARRTAEVILGDREAPLLDDPR